jgi:uncharacterized protein DUF3883
MPWNAPTVRLEQFNLEYDTSAEDRAAESRGDFLVKFPRNRLRDMTLEEYVIGTGKPTFCTYAEVNTKPWANILGATAFKFGIYFGRTKTDPRRRYRFVKRFGNNTDDANKAFTAVKGSLLNLIDAGRSRRFGDVDDNELSQMFKAKILCLYFPDIYVNICSAEHIKQLASIMQIPAHIPVSEQQHLLLEEKLHNDIARSWSNPKFMAFLYNTYVTPQDKRHLKTLRTRRPPEIDMDDLLENRKKIGEMSEAYALKWEKKRLIGSGYKQLIRKIEDRRKAPAYGYDFRSYSEPNRERFIEVKSVGRNRTGTGYRFFLSENEHLISKSEKHQNDYYFYLVFYEDGKPAAVEAWKAGDLYEICKCWTNGFVITFDREDPIKYYRPSLESLTRALWSYGA